MASNYGTSFGFRRSDNAVREGRFYVPATGVFKQGDLVTIDPANPGFIKKAAANQPIVPGVTGLLIQESSHLRSVYAGTPSNSVYLENVNNGESCAIWTGDHLKVWVLNREARATAGGRPGYEARTILNTTGMTLGGMVAWNGSMYVSTTDPTAAVGTVTLLIPTAAGSPGAAEFALAK